MSINEGRTFTTDCTRRLDGTRAPLIYDFSPKESLIADSATITLSGVGFDSSVRYWCQFAGPGALQTTTEATFVSGSSIQCEKPLVANSEDTHPLEVSVYYSPQWAALADQTVPPVLAKRFS